MSDKDQIHLLKNGNKDVLKKLYITHKSGFINYAKKFSISSEDILDIYQDAVIILFNNAKKGKLDNLKCSLKTYQFSIGKNLIYETLRAKKRLVNNNDILYKDDYDVTFENDLIIQKNEQQQLLIKAIGQLGKSCQDILTLFYYNGYTIDEIMTKLNYVNKNVVKSQKSRCLASLKKIVKNG
jgi:RNA polymerase sigma factor (sigma-70 family)